MVEKRKTPRMPAGYEVFLNYQGRTCVGRSRDISNLGMGVFTQDKLDPGQKPELKIMLPEAPLTISLTGDIRYSINHPPPNAGLPFLTGVEFLEEPDEAFSFIKTKGEVKRVQASHSLAIGADAARCYKAIQEFEHYPKWAKIMEQVKVLDRHPDGRPKRVEFHLNIYIRKVLYILEYAYDDPNCCLSFQNTGGDVLSIKGSYGFKPLGERHCSSNYKLAIAFDFPLPNRVANYLSNIGMRKSMKDFKSYVEKKA